jgi:hypothetical protein
LILWGAVADREYLKNGPGAAYLGAERRRQLLSGGGGGRGLHSSTFQLNLSRS